MIEFGVARDNEPHEMHRGPMTESEAREWIREWEEDVAPQARRGLFVVICRSVGDWMPA